MPSRVGAGKYAGNPLRPGALPLFSGQQVEPWLSTVRFSHRAKTVRTFVAQLVDPEPVAKIRHLYNHWLYAQVQCPNAVNDILVGTGYRLLLRLDIIR